MVVDDTHIATRAHALDSLDSRHTTHNTQLCKLTLQKDGTRMAQ